VSGCCFLFIIVTDGTSLANTGVRTISATVHVGDYVTEPVERTSTDGVVVESVNVPDATGKCSGNVHASQSTYRSVKTTHRDRRRGGHVAWEVDELNSDDHRDSNRAGQIHTTTGIILLLLLPLLVLFFLFSFFFSSSYLFFCFIVNHLGM